MFVPMKIILDDANANNYGVIAANVINMELVRGAIDAATERNAPIIISIGPAQMDSHGDGIAISAMVREFASRTPVPVALHLDHGKVDRAISYAFRNGFSSIMFDGSEYPFEENVRRTRKVVELGHLEGVSVEGELGHVGVGAAGDHARRDLYTRPEDARRFVEETGVDALAVAFGTAHGPYPKGIIPTLDFDRLKAIKDSLGMPIVMHGGSSSGDDNIRHAVKCGINKINVCSDTFVACVDAVAKVTSEDPGVGFIKLLNLMEKAAADTIGHYIELASSVGKAANFAPFFDPYRAFWVKTEKKLHE